MITYIKSDNALKFIALFYRYKTEQDAKHRNFQYSNHEIDILAECEKNEINAGVTRIKTFFLFRNIFR